MDKSPLVGSPGYSSTIYFNSGIWIQVGLFKVTPTWIKMTTTPVKQADVGAWTSSRANSSQWTFAPSVRLVKSVEWDGGTGAVHISSNVYFMTTCVCQLVIRVKVRLYRGLCTDLLVFTLQLRKTPEKTRRKERPWRLCDLPSPQMGGFLPSKWGWYDSTAR